MKITAIDALLRAGVKTPGDKIGKMSVFIGGIAINNPSKVINVMEDTVTVTVGNESFEADMTGELTAKEIGNVENALKAKGERSTAAFNASQLAKAENGEFGTKAEAAIVLERRGVTTEDN